MIKTVMVTGSAGFVGARLIPRLLGAGFKVIGIDLAPLGPATSNPAVTQIIADTTRPGAWQEAVASADAVINLAGKNIYARWSDKIKQEILESRVTTTENIVSAIPEGKDMVLMSASAAGYYGDRGDQEVDESFPPGEDFLARVCVDWEKTAMAAEAKGARVVCMRFGLILGNGGALKAMLPAFGLGLGGPIAGGKFYMSWIHIDDLISAIFFLMENSQISGPVNFTSPNPVQNKEFVRKLASVLKRPAFIPMPGLALRLVFGELGKAISGSQRVIPKKLMDAGFSFRYPMLEDALKSILAN